MKSLFIAIVFDNKPLHIIKGYFALIVSIEYSLIGCYVSGSGVELFIHGSIQIHQHFAGSNGL